MGFIGPYGYDDEGGKHEMAKAACISDDHHNCKSCIGTDCGKPNVLLYAGTDVPNAVQYSQIWK